MSNDGTLRKIGKGAFVFILGLAFSKLFGIFYKALVARTGPYNYGVLSLGIGIFGFFSMIATMGLDLGVTKYVAYYRQKIDDQRIKGIITSAMKLAFTFSLILSVIGFFLAETIAVRIFHNKDLVIVLRILLLIIPFDALRKIFISTTKAFQYVKFETYSRDLIENLVKLGVTIVVLLIGASVAGLSVAFASGIIASFIASVYFMERKVFPVFRTKIVSVKQYNELLTYSWPLLFTSLLFLLSLWTDSFLIGYFKDASVVGKFNAAGPIAFLVYFLPQALMAIFLPIITDLKASGDKETLESTYKTITRWIFISGLMVVAAIAIFNKNLIMFVFGDKYIEASIPLIILAVGYFVNSYIFTAQRLLMAFDKTRLIFADTIVSFAVNILLASWLIPKYGMIGAATATASSFAMLSIITMIQSKLIIKIKTLEKWYVFQAIPVIATTSLIFYFRSYFQGLYFILGILLIPMISLIIIYLTKGYSDIEKRLIIDAIGKLKKP